MPLPSPYSIRAHRYGAVAQLIGPLPNGDDLPCTTSVLHGVALQHCQASAPRSSLRWCPSHGLPDGMRPHCPAQAGASLQGLVIATCSLPRVVYKAVRSNKQNYTRTPQNSAIRLNQRRSDSLESKYQYIGVLTVNLSRRRLPIELRGGRAGGWGCWSRQCLNCRGTPSCTTMSCTSTPGNSSGTTTLRYATLRAQAAPTRSPSSPKRPSTCAGTAEVEDNGRPAGMASWPGWAYHGPT